jgi:amino acid adenylation domain-containing protein
MSERSTDATGRAPMRVLSTTGTPPDPTERLDLPPTRTVLSDIEMQAERQPDAVAVDDGATTLTYAQLWRAAGAQGALLVRAGVDASSRVVVTGARDAAFVTVLVGVLRSGAVAVPVPAGLPPERAAAMVAGSKATHLVHTGRRPGWAGRLRVVDACTRGEDAPTIDVDPSRPASVYFTSGSTGTPRAVAVGHAAIARLAAWHREAFALASGERVGLVTSTGSVASARVVLGSLAAGATVVPAPDDVLPEDGLAWLARHHVTVVHLTPSRARSWLEHAPSPRPRTSLRCTSFGGEALTDALVRDWQEITADGAQVVSIYGTTETGGACSVFVVPDQPVVGRQPLGWPVPGAQLLVLDGEGNLCRDGTTGEIAVRAATVARGYENDPEASAARFGPNPFTDDPADLVYRTGDMGWYRPDGSVMFAGRRDDQVNLDGARVELGEVAARLETHPRVRAAHVEPDVDDTGCTRLVAFIAATHERGDDCEPAEDRERLDAALRRWCSAVLPAVAIPSQFVTVPELPTSAVGKVDRQALLSLLAAGHQPREVRPDPTVPLAEPAPGTVLDDIERHVAADPGAPALDDGTVTLTYDELWARAGAIAGALAALGVTTGDRVVLTGPRSTAFAAAALGVLRAGAVLVPCASTLPPARCAAMASEAAARQVVSVGPPPDWADGLDTLGVDRHAVPVDAGVPDAAAVPEPAPVGPHAVIFFTSGTTGAPKAVLGRHPSIAHYLRWWRDTFDVRPGDRVAMATSTAFDVTLRNLFGPLCAGATVCIAPDDLLPEDGLSWLARARVHVLHLTPSLAQAWLTEAVDGSCAQERPLRWTLFAGEMLTDDLVRRWRVVNPGRIGNMYGPTETTMSRCLYVVPDEPVAGPQPVGFPLPGSQVLVVDEHDALCPVGQPGEVLIRTRSGTAGYANDPDLQAARFVTNPFTGDPTDVVYRTGDVGSYRPDGSLQLSGRVDDQVKIGGVRVEPAEVAAVLGSHDDVRAAHVLVRRDDDGPTLVAYVAAPGSDRLRAALRRRCGEALPAAAIPTAFVFVDRLPLTPNGKVDRAALAALGTPTMTAATATAAPAADAAVPVLTLDALVEVWRDVLRRDDVHADTNFFDAGGTSVTAVRLAHRLRAYVDEPPTLLDLLEQQTPRALAVHLRATTTEDPATTPVPVHRLVANRARTAPDDVALDDGSAGTAYATLEQQVRAVAGVLVRAGVRPGALVAVHTRRVASIVPVLLGIHRAGAGYVPVDPDLPSGRVTFLLEDTAPAVVVSDRPVSTTAPVVTLAELEAHLARADGTIADVEVPDDPERVAYVIYTSGSTGNPKGVLVPHRALCAYADASNDHFRLRPGDRLLQYHSLSFDSSVEEIFCTLAAGATLVLPGTPMLGSAGWFLDEIERLRVTVLDLPTSYWTGLVDDLVDGGLSLPATVRSVVIGGSAADARTVSRWNRHVHGVALLNAYGPTEVTIAATIADLSDLRADDAPVPIGPPLRGVRAIVADEHDRPAVDGAPGELLLGGAQLALGYLERPELTAARFVVDPTGATDERYYRTGDRVHRLPDGSLVFEGRIDDQVKIRGFRIELGEVEAAFGEHPAVREAVAVVEGAGADARLVVHLTFQAGRTASTADLRAHAATRLPSYAVPASIEPRAEIPRTAGGKPDRRALRSGVRAPLGFAQEQQWFLSRLEPLNPAYNMATGVLLDGPLDADALELALNLVVERHETFRTRYLDDDGVPSQVIDAPVPLRLERLRAEAGDGESAFDAAVRAHLARGAVPFDLASDTLLRPALLTIEPDRHLLSLCTHHIAVDGWSIDLLVDELRAAYAAYVAGTVPALPIVEAQPRDLAARDRALERDGSLARALDRWQQRLTPLPPALALPLALPRPATRDPKGATVEVACAEGTAASLRAAARALRTTEFAAGLALFGEYLAARASTPDLVIGVPTAGREEPDSQRTIAMRVATLPHRHRSDASRTVQEAIVETTRRLREDLASTPAPFDHIVRRLQPPREPGLHPIFQVTFQTGGGQGRYGPMHDVEVRPLGIGRGSAKFDVSCTLVTTDELVCSFVFARDVFDDPTMHELAAGFARFVDVALEDLRRPVREVVSRSASTPMRGAGRSEATPATEPPRRHAAGRGDDDLLASVRAAFADVLGHAVGEDDDFFAAGGHSLLAVRLCSRLERETGVRLGLASVFEAPSPRRIAALLRGEDPSPASTDPDPHHALLSLAQERMWVEEQLAGGGSRYVELFGRRIRGPLDVAALQDALACVAERHEPLRTRIVRTPDGPTAVVDPPGPVAWREVSAGDAVDEAARVAAIDEELVGRARQPMDLERGPLFDCTLLRLAHEDHALVVRVHHAMFDGGAVDIFLLDLVEAYTARLAGERPGWSPLPLSYRAFARRQRDEIAGGAAAADVAWWGAQLRALPEPPALPYDRPAPADHGPTGAVVELALDGDFDAGAAALATDLGTTRHRVGLALTDVFLHVLTGADDLTLGMAASERLDDETRPLVGLFVNTLPIRVRVDAGTTFRALVQRVHETVEEALVHRRAPIDAIAARVRADSGVELRDLLRASFEYRPLLRSEQAPFGAATMTRLRKPEQCRAGAKFDIDLSVDRRHDGTRLRFRYDSARFDASTARAMAALFTDLARLALASPDVALGELAAGLRRPGPAPTVRATDTDAPVPAAPVRAARGANAARTPDATLDRPARLWLSRAPMSFAQRRVWLLERLGVARDAYLLTSTFELFGQLDVDALRQALEATARRHEVLRTRFVETEDGLAEQVIDRDPLVELHVLDPGEGRHTDEHTEAQIEADLRRAAKQPFDLVRQHPWRAVVARLGDGHALLALTVHHLATDGESQELIQRDLFAAYRSVASGATPDLDPPPLQYADHAVWQHARAASNALDDALGFWLETFRTIPDALELPSARPRATDDAAGADVVVHGGAARRERLRSFARANRTTPFAVLLGTYVMLLHRLTGRQDIVVGIPVTERRMDLDSETVGFFVNTVPVRVRIDPTVPLADAFAEMQRATREAIAHADTPLDLILDRLDVPRDAATNPLIPTMFSMQERAGTEGRILDGLRIRPTRLGGTGTAKFDLSLLALEGEGIDLLFEYRSDLFDRAVVESWGRQYLCLLDALLDRAAHEVGSTPVLDPATRQWLVHGCNRTRRPYPREATVIELFDDIVQEHATRIAVVEGDRSLTYGELAARSTRLADRLREAGVRPGDRVALAMRRSTELIVAMLATLRTGAAYVPLDPTYPEERRRQMLALAAPRAVVEPDGRIETITSLDAASAGTGDPDAGAPAYVMFTSGSTGTPKGVVVPHRGIVRLVRDTDYVQFGPELVLAHLSNTSFDAATFEIWGALLNGARLVVLDNDTITAPTAFAEAVHEHGITTMFVTTALFNVIAREAPEAFAPLEHLLFGGEAADADAVRSVLAHSRPRMLANVYGPTESTTFAAWYPIDRLAPHATVVPIGGPIANTTLHVVDERGEPVPPTVHGELVIGGDGLALGYLDDPELSAARFVHDPFSDEPGARLYRTGDIVRRRLDGVIEFVGRRDDQVKVRGFRIELGEIEAALRRLEPVQQAFVTTHRSAPGDASITGYVVASDAGSCNGDALRDALRAQLPAYMVPEAVVVVDALPRNANGKIDRAALPVPTRLPVHRTAPARAADLASCDPLVAVLLELCAAVLERSDIGPDDDFFVLGGTSVRAVRLFAAVERRLGARLALSTLLEAPTPRALGERLRREHGIEVRRDHGPSGATDPVLVTLRAGDPSRRPSFVAVHPAGGQLFAYAPLLASLPDDQPVIGIKEYGWGDPARRLESVEEYAAHYVDELLAERPTGDLVLAGYSLGGLLAYEMARLLDARGRRPRLVVLLDAAPVARPGDAPVLRQPALTKLRRRHARDGMFGVVRGAGRILERAVTDRVVDPVLTAADHARLTRAVRHGGPVDALLVGRESERHGLVLRQRYRPGPYRGRVVLFRALGTDPDFPITDVSHRWRSVADRLDIIDVPGNHANEGSMLHPPRAGVVGRELTALLDGLVRSPDDRRPA